MRLSNFNEYLNPLLFPKLSQKFTKIAPISYINTETKANIRNKKYEIKFMTIQSKIKNLYAPYLKATL